MHARKTGSKRRRNWFGYFEWPLTMTTQARRNDQEDIEGQDVEGQHTY